jgi:hypothetical protein
MNSAEYLDTTIKQFELRNDNQLAVKLGWSRQKISNYRNLKQAMDNDEARVIAEILEVPTICVIADMEIQRARKGKNLNAWKTLAKMSKQSGKATANLLIQLPFISFLVANIIYYVK